MIRCLLFEQIGDVGTPFMELLTPVVPRVGETLITSRPGKDEIVHYKVIGVNYACASPLGRDDENKRSGMWPQRALQDVELEVEFEGHFEPLVEAD